MVDLRRRLSRVRHRSVAWLESVSGRARRARARLDGSAAAVLMYHRVLPREEAQRRAVEPGMYVRPETFALHAELLDDLFTVMPLHEIVTRIRRGQPLPPGACAITFDDGWRDNFDHALPILESRDLPATVFVVTDRVGTPGAFWPDEVSRRLVPLPVRERWEHARSLALDAGDGSVHAILTGLKTLPERELTRALDRLRERTADPMAADRELLDWKELESLSERGIDIESHGVRHAILTRIGSDEVDRELRESLRALRARGHARHALFAYPSGEYDLEIVGRAGEAGYVGAVTTRPGLVGVGTEPRLLPRIGLHDDISSTQLELLRWVPGRARVVDLRSSAP